MKQIAWDEVMKRLEVASKICNDASPVQVEGPIHVGVDLGTADVVVMAVDDNGMPVSAFLEWATVVRDGVVVDYHGAITIVKRLVSMTEERLGRKITEASTSYPPGTDARLSTNILDAANLRLVSTADEPSCLARLARLDRAAVVDIGGGTTDMGVLSLSGIAISRSIKTAGNAFDEAIIKYVRRKYNLIIGKRMAEEAKIAIGCVYPRKEMVKHRVKGRNAMTGLPQWADISCDEMLEALIEPAMQIIYTVQEMLEKTPPELMGDVYSDGIILTGGSSQLFGFDKLISKKTKMPVRIAEEPDMCVARGAGLAIKYIEDIESKAYGVLNPLSAAY